VENRFQSLPFKCNLQRYTAVRHGTLRLAEQHMRACLAAANAASAAAAAASAVAATSAVGALHVESS
jgi:hypothetical protein